MAVMVLSLSACSQNNAQTVYSNSVDVPLLGWTSADTLFYNITVTEPATIKSPIAIRHDYQMNVDIRCSSSYPLSSIDYHLLLQKMDTTGGYNRPVANLLRQEITTVVRDTTGTPLGDTWGSLITLQTTRPDLSVRFDSAGLYRILLIPELGELREVPGIASVCISLK